MEERLFEVVERLQNGEEQAIVAKYMNLDNALLLMHALIEKYHREDIFLEIRPMRFCTEAAVGE